MDEKRRRNEEIQLLLKSKKKFVMKQFQIFSSNKTYKRKRIVFRSILFKSG